MPRKKEAVEPQEGTSQRPRRSVQPKKCYTPDPSSSEEHDPATSADSEAEQQQARGRPVRTAVAKRTQAAATTAPRARGAAAGGRQTQSRPTRGKSAAAANPPADHEGSDSDDVQVVDSDNDEEDDDDDDMVEVQPAPGGRRQSSRVAAKQTVATTRAGTSKKAAPAKAAATAVAAAAKSTRGKASGGSGSAAAGPAAKAGATRGRAASKPGGAEEEGAGDEDEEDEDEEDDQEEEEEAPAAVPAARSRGGGARGSRGGAAGARVPTSNESRKRLFELLERRVGSITADGSGGRRVLYGDLPVKNPNKKAKLMVDLRSQFDDWHSRLRSNFSVLLYGFGSKRILLDEFARTLAGPRNRGDAAVLVFHGYNPRCTARDVITGVASALLQRTFRLQGGAAAAGGAGGGGSAVSAAPAALRALVDEIRSEPLDRHAFVVIHNLDGPGLRADVSLLSALAACPQVHVIASVDHALAPLLWDSADGARFRWQYINATTFQPYLAETNGMQSVLLGAFKSGVVTAGAGTVLRSLVLGAQEVFRVLAQYLLDDDQCEGVAFAHLYRMCRERYLVRDEQVLRQHLVEFIDHQLVRTRAASDNSGELLTIDMGHDDLREVLADLDAARKGAA